MAEWYARDISKKIKAVMHTRALAGKHLSGYPVYGYMQDPNDKNHWIVDEESAEVVREIYHLCLCGHGPSQIARILNNRGVDSPSVRQRKIGFNAPSDNIYWQSAIVAKILKRMDYLGHTVCGMSYKKSYKDKRSCHKPKDEWVITENTHEKIVDIDTWERVQKLRENTKRRPPTIGEMGALNGILFCADCNKRLRIHRSQKTSQKESYICPTYSNTKRFGKGQCTMHSTPRPFIEALILSEIQRVTEFARDREDEFVALVEKTYEHTSNIELQANRMEIEKAQRRISELDQIIQRLYEDNVAGRMSNERFDKMYVGFEAE